METIKAGTRCECANGCTVENCTTWEDVAKTPPLTHACGIRAVRLVTVPAVTGGSSRPDWQAKGYGAKIQRPMCAACAEYHESKVSS